jgi:arylsulfatase
MEPGEFRGVQGRYHHESVPWWPEPVRPRDGAPNIVIVVLDDVGYAQLGCFGSDIATPTIDGLAAEGLLYANFHTTALCSPTRAALLTGRNHHANGMGRISELATGFPGYDGRIPRANAMAPAVLVPAGYAGRSSSSPTCGPSTRRSRSSSTSPPAPATRRTSRRRITSSATAARSTTGGTSGASARSPGR